MFGKNTLIMISIMIDMLYTSVTLNIWMYFWTYSVKFPAKLLTLILQSAILHHNVDSLVLGRLQAR